MTEFFTLSSSTSSFLVPLSTIVRRSLTLLSHIRLEQWWNKQRITYAKSTSHASILHTSGAEALYAVRMSGKLVNGAANGPGASRLTVSDAQKKLLEAEARKGKKRGRDDGSESEGEDDGAERKRKREDGEEEDADMEVEMDQSDDEAPATTKKEKEKEVVEMPATREAGETPYQVLFIEGLPREVTDDMLAVLFQQYPGFQTVRLVPSLKPGQPNSGLAFVQYDTPSQAETAKIALDGFQLARGVVMKVGWAKRG